jgi:hypothetical protein
MDEPTNYTLSPEAQALLQRLVQERDAAIGRLDVAIISMKAALGVPVEWQLRSIEQGFVKAAADGSNN